MSYPKHSIAFCSALPTVPPKPIIEVGVLYEDPIAGRRLKWFIGTMHRTSLALTCLSTGTVFPYPGGKLPGQMRRVGPGTLTIVIDIEGGTS